MSAPSADRTAPLDYGVQIRFIKDLHDTGGGVPVGARGSGGTKGIHNATSSKYGVAVRVQGIAGQPYVVLKGGQKGDSYGVQLKTQPRDYNYPPAYNSLPRRREEGQVPEPPQAHGEGSSLRRARSHGSLLDREPLEDIDGHLRRPPGDGRSGSYGNLDGNIGVGGERGETHSIISHRMSRTNWTGSYQAGLNGSLDRDDGRRAGPDPSPVGSARKEPVHTVGTESLGPINRLISHFDSSAPSSQTQRRFRAQERVNFEELKCSNSLDAREIVSESTASPFYSPPTSNHSISPPPPLSSSSYSSLGRSSTSVAKVTAFSASKPNYSRAPGAFVTMATPPATQPETQVSPGSLMNQDQYSELLSEEEQIKQSIYSILQDGNNESVSATKCKVNLVFEKIQGLKCLRNGTQDEASAESWRKERRELERRLEELQSSLLEERRNTQKVSAEQTLKAELEDCLDENLQLQEQLDRKKTELHQAHGELTQLRMDRESAESQVRDLEDQLAGMQDELRRDSDSRAQLELLQMELMSARAELAEAGTVRQRQEEALRQRERELTALKGALKDEVSTHDREMETLREQYRQDVEKLRRDMVEVSQSQAGVEAERQRVNSAMRMLQQQLEELREESSHWREQFQSSRDELRSTKQELLQARLEKEDSEEEIKELQERLVTMKEQMPDPTHTSNLTQDLERCRSELKQSKAELEKQKAECDKRRMEILSVKKASQEREAEQKYEMDRLMDRSRKDKEDLAKALDRVKQRPDPSVVEELQQQVYTAREREQKLQESVSSAELELQVLRQQLAAAQVELQTHRDTEQELQGASARLREKVVRLEAQLQTSMSQSLEAEQVLEQQNRSLRTQLEESRRAATRLGQEKEEVSRRLEERESEREGLRKAVAELEEQKAALERALEKSSKEMEQLNSGSQQQARTLQTQLEDYRERCKKEQQEAQRQSREQQAELERAQGSLKTLQEEVSRLKKELLACTEEKDTAQLDKDLLSSRLKHLEAEMEVQRGSHTDRTREVRSLEDKVKHLQMELDEEKNSIELLTDRISRSRDQIDQLRAELMQERSSKQDLELDKNSLERQMKEMKSRLAELEGQSRSSTGYAQMESKMQELEERLHSEEREKNSLQASQRRLERKLKELTITLDEERQQHSEQRDQLSLRVKALKRQVDEGEGEVERLETLRKKALRDLEEQLELKEALQGRVSALEAELKRKIQQSHRPILDSSALSSDDDDDGLYDPSSITSILTEGNLQTSSC